MREGIRDKLVKERKVTFFGLHWFFGLAVVRPDMTARSPGTSKLPNLWVWAHYNSMLFLKIAQLLVESQMFDLLVRA